MDDERFEKLASTVISLSNSVLQLCDTLKYLQEAHTNTLEQIRGLNQQSLSMIEIQDFHAQAMKIIIDSVKGLQIKVDNNQLDWRSE